MLCNDCHGAQGPQGPYTCHCGKVDNYFHEWAEEFSQLVAGKVWYYDCKTYQEVKDVTLELLVNLEPEIKKLKFFSKVS